MESNGRARPQDDGGSGPDASVAGACPETPETSRTPGGAEANDWVRARTREWRRAGIIASEQRDAILAFESIDSRHLPLGRRYRRLIAILSTLGAILVGVGVILFVGSNWRGIPDPARLVLVLAVVIAANVIGYQLRYARGHPRVGAAVLLVGALAYGAAIFLVAQIYHMDIENPNLLSWWFAGAVPMAYLTRSRSILALAIMAALGGLGWRVATWLHGDERTAFLALYLFLGAAGVGLGMAHEGNRAWGKFAAIYLGLSALVAVLFLYLLTFDFPYRETARATPDGVRLASERASLAGVYIIAGIATAVAVVAVGFGLRRRPLRGGARTTVLYEAAAAFAALAAGALALSTPFASPIAYQALFNLWLFAFTIGAIAMGLVSGREILVNIGIVFFAIHLITRYVDLTWNMLESSVFFMVGGVFLLAAGYALERVRRRLIARLGLEEVGDEP